MVKFRNKSTCLPLCANVLLVFTQDGMSCFLLFCWVPHLPQCISAGLQNITQRPVGLHCNARVSWNAFDLSKVIPLQPPVPSTGDMLWLCLFTHTPSLFRSIESLAETSHSPLLLPLLASNVVCWFHSSFPYSIPRCYSGLPQF